MLLAGKPWSALPAPRRAQAGASETCTCSGCPQEAQAAAAGRQAAAVAALEAQVLEQKEKYEALQQELAALKAKVRGGNGGATGSMGRDARRL